METDWKQRAEKAEQELAIFTSRDARQAHVQLQDFYYRLGIILGVEHPGYASSDEMEEAAKNLRAELTNLTEFAADWRGQKSRLEQQCADCEAALAKLHEG